MQKSSQGLKVLYLSNLVHGLRAQSERVRYLKFEMAMMYCAQAARYISRSQFALDKLIFLLWLIL